MMTQFSFLVELYHFTCIMSHRDSLNVANSHVILPQVQQAVAGAATSSSAPPSVAPKATFPAYTQSSSSPANSSSTVAKPGIPVTSKPATLTTTSATSKLIHPDEDISLVSVCFILV